MSTLLLPGTDLVAVGWLRLVPGPDPTRISTKLPDDDAKIRAPGFVRATIVGGSPNREMPLRAPVVACECWAAPAAGSEKLPWGVANQLAEQILDATWNPALAGIAVDLSAVGDGYANARVEAVTALTEPRRVPDPSGYARFDVEILINWYAER